MARTPILTTAELRAVEEAHAEQVPPLMERAGAAVARAACHLAPEGKILLVAGPGNNGGDAKAAARRLVAAGREVVLRTPTDGPWPGEAPALIVDGLLGIGLARDVDGAFAEIVRRINAAPCPVLAIDVPSGLDSETGNARGTAVRATRTLTFIAHKAGLHTQDGPDLCGDVVLDDLGLGAATAAAGAGALLSPESVRAWLRPRPRNAHKGSFGTLGIVGGASGMVGAALLAGRAALLCGAGKIRVGLLSGGLPVDPVHPELMMSTPEAALEGDVVVIGPGGGALQELLARALALRVPLVVDADALNAVARDATLRQALVRRGAPIVLTPHPGEAARLLGCATPDVQADRRAAALRLATSFNATIVLKGNGSVCASPKGAWSINATGNPGLASGGTGDVLAGMIGALLAQRMDTWQALQCAVCLHGAAADALVARGSGPAGLTASEVALEARRLLNSWTSL